jgi:hypothetical protein
VRAVKCAVLSLVVSAIIMLDVYHNQTHDPPPDNYCTVQNQNVEEENN